MSEQHKYTQQERTEHCVLDLEAAVYQAVKAPRGTLGKICETFGLNYNTAALQVNPNRDSHTLPPSLIEQALSITQSALIMDAICCAHGNAAWFLLPNDTEQSDDIIDIAVLGQRFADLNSTALDAYADRIIEPDEFAAIQRDAQAIQRQVQTIVENARANMVRHQNQEQDNG